MPFPTLNIVQGGFINAVIFSLISRKGIFFDAVKSTATSSCTTSDKTARMTARIAKYIVHTGNVKYIALSNKEMESIYKIVMY